MAKAVACPLVQQGRPCLSGNKTHRPGSQSLQNCRDVASGKKSAEDFQRYNDPRADFAETTKNMKKSETEGSSARFDDQGRMHIYGLNYKDGTMAETIKAELVNGIQNVTEDPEIMADYLDFCKDLYRYSPRNRMLLYLQEPEAHMFRSKKQWEALGFKVKGDARPCMIMAPVLKNITDSEGEVVRDEDGKAKKRLVGYRYTKVISNAGIDESVKKVPVPPLRKHFDDYMNNPDLTPNEALNTDLEMVVKDLGIPVSYKTKDEDRRLAAGAAGYCYKDHEGNTKIVLDSGSQDHARIQTFAHELGHILAGHLDEKEKGAQVGSRHERQNEEAEAEVFAYAIARKYGSDAGEIGQGTYSYLRSWESDDLESQISKAMDTAQKSIAVFEERLEKIVTGESESDRINEANKKNAEIARKRKAARAKTRKKR